MHISANFRKIIHGWFVFLCLWPHAVNAETIGLPIGTVERIVIDVPDGCVAWPRTDPNFKGCQFIAEDSGIRNIAFHVKAVTIGQFMSAFGARKYEFAIDPGMYLRRMLLEMDRQATSAVPAQGQQVLVSISYIQSQTDNPEGFDECLVFDFDFSAEMNTEHIRADGTGVRCLGYDMTTDQIVYAYIKYANAHNNVAQRTKDLGREARPILDSLRIE